MTIMNLSRSGQQKLSQFLFEYGSFMDGLRETPGTIRFNESDFEDCVVLTTKEAETIEHIIAIFQHYYILFGAEMKVWQDLRKKIEQAQKKAV